MIFKGKNRDTARYSILDDEWPGVRAIPEAWRDQSNFDLQGVAQASPFGMMQDRPPGQRGNQS